MGQKKELGVAVGDAHLNAGSCVGGNSSYKEGKHWGEGLQIWCCILRPPPNSHEVWEYPPLFWFADVEAAGMTVLLL